jgi:hypothetical protein
VAPGLGEVICVEASPPAMVVVSSILAASALDAE